MCVRYWVKEGEEPAWLGLVYQAVSSFIGVGFVLLEHRVVEKVQALSNPNCNVAYRHGDSA
jgi:hypothetical protein